MYYSKCGKQAVEGGIRKGVEGKFISQFTKQGMKWLIMNVIWTAVVCLIWYQSQKDMFDIGSGFRLSIRDLVYAEDLVSLTLDYNPNAFFARVSYWCYVMGKLIYVLAVVQLWNYKEEIAKVLLGLGFICHFPIFCYVTKGLMILCMQWGYGSVDYKFVMEAINEEFWIYVALNMVVVICMAVFGGIVDSQKRPRRRKKS